MTTTTPSKLPPSVEILLATSTRIKNYGDPENAKAFAQALEYAARQGRSGRGHCRSLVERIWIRAGAYDPPAAIELYSREHGFTEEAMALFPAECAEYVGKIKS